MHRHFCHLWDPIPGYFAPSFSCHLCTWLRVGRCYRLAKGATLTTGFAEHDHSTVTNVDDAFDVTAALNYSNGPFSIGVQKKVHNEGEGTAATTDAIWYKDTIVGIAYAINDDLSISYNTYESQRHNSDSANLRQETDAISIGYAIGGMTLGFQEASTDNKSWATGTDDTRTVSVKVAF